MNVVERKGALGFDRYTIFFGGATSFSPPSAMPQGFRLRKDFIIDPWQVLESRWLGADAVLLMARCLDPSSLMELSDLALEIGLDVLLEVHHDAELEAALACDARVVLGINHRDLRTLEMKPDHALRLRPKIPDGRVCVAESGIEAPRADSGSLRWGLWCIFGREPSVVDRCGRRSHSEFCQCVNCRVHRCHGSRSVA